VGGAFLLTLACTLHPGPGVVARAIAAPVAPAAEGQWASLGPDGGTVTGLAIHPDNPAVLYAGTDAAGVFKTTDGGASWSAVNTGLTSPLIRALGFHPAAPNTLYAGTDGSGLFRTTDGGETWTAVNTGAFAFIGLAFDPRTPDTLYLAANTGVLKTTDGGANWTNVLPILPWSVAVSPDDPDTLYVGTGSGVSKSTDGGATWTPASTGLPQAAVLTLALDPDAPGTLYAGMLTSGVFKTTNGGTSWAAASNGLPGVRIYALALDVTDTGTLYAATHGSGIFKTTDGGASWAAVNTGVTAPAVLALALHPTNPETVYAGAQAQGVFRTTNAGESWTTVNAGLGAVEVRALAFDPTTPDILYAGGYGGGSYFAGQTGYGVFKTDDGGASWSAVNTGLASLSVSALAVHPFDPDTLYVGTSGGVFKSTNGGAAWSLSTAADVECLAVHPSFPQVVYAGIAGGNLLRTTSGGGSWEPAGVNDVTALALHPTDSNTVYAGTSSSGVFKTTDFGTYWTAVNTGLSDLDILSLALDPSAPNTLYAGTNGGGVFKTTDGGASWTAVNTGLSGMVAYVVAVNPINPAMVYVATEAGGVFQSTDGGGTWSALGTGLAPQRVRALAFTHTSPMTPMYLTVYAGGGGGVAALLPAYVMADPIAPSGTIIPAMPTFTWGAVPGVATYRLRVLPGGTITLPPAVAGCAAGESTCHFTWPVALPAGPAGWSVQTVYPDGEGPWSDSLTFTIVIPAPGAPAGLITDPTPTYTWTALPGAAYYYLSVTDSGAAGRVGEWYSAAQAGCGSGTGTCRITPTTALDSGGASWAIRAWNTGGAGPWSPTQSFQVDRLPAVPMARGQLQANGTTPIPLGGTATSTTVVFRGTVNDPDAGQKVRLQVEVKPVGTAFTGSVSCYSVLTSSGTPATCKVTGLPLGRYHWRVRAKDSLNAVSAWASYATNAESAADFIVSTAPAVPTSRGQLQANGTTAIPLGGKATSTTVVFRGTVSDPDPGQTVRLQVEVKPVGTAFTGTVSCQSALVTSGTAATCAVRNLMPSASYHWRLRAMDALGTPGAWASYATNAETSADFTVGP
jgi:photosystem II stability/assembly factor-like uncharacterized protein